MPIAAAMSSAHKKSSFAKLALFFGFGDSSATPRPPPAAPIPPSPAGSAVGLAFIASMSTADVAAVRAGPLLHRSDGRPDGVGATRGLKRGVPPPSPAANGMDRVEADEQQRRGAQTTSAAKRSRQHEGGFGRGGDNDDSVTGLPDLLPPPSWTEEEQLVAEFLRRCFGCKEELAGRDIYMYQGDKAFCSEECRHQKMELDEMRRRRKRQISGGAQGREHWPDESLDMCIAS